MNIANLRKAERAFLERYPAGFESPEMVEVGKKHRMEQMTALARECFGKDAFANPQKIAEDMIKIVSRASMVSPFEKPKFRDFVKSLNQADTGRLAAALKLLIHGDQPRGFGELVELLWEGKIAKWSLVTVVPVYYAPNDEVFVKPTTAKGIVRDFADGELVYKPQPTWEFYNAYRQLITNLKKEADPSLSPSNPAFTGFLMVSMGY